MIDYKDLALVAMIPAFSRILAGGIMHQQASIVVYEASILTFIGFVAFFIFKLYDYHYVKNKGVVV